MAAFHAQELEFSSELLRAIAHPLRLQILAFIDQKKVINVNKIYNTLKLEQSITSQHLRILRSTELVSTRREGKFIYYSVNYEKVAQVNAAILEFTQKVNEATLAE